MPVTKRNLQHLSFVLLPDDDNNTVFTSIIFPSPFLGCLFAQSLCIEGVEVCYDGKYKLHTHRGSNEHFTVSHPCLPPPPPQTSPSASASLGTTMTRRTCVGVACRWARVKSLPQCCRRCKALASPGTIPLCSVACKVPSLHCARRLPCRQICADTWRLLPRSGNGRVL